MTSEDDEVVMLEGFGLCTLIQRDDPSLVTVRLPSGQCIRLGDKAIERLRATSSDDVPDDKAKH